MRSMHKESWHCDLKVSSSQAKINENFANYFLKPKANNKCLIVLKCTCKGLQKSISVNVVKSKPKALRHFKVDPVLKFYETFYSMWDATSGRLYGIVLVVSLH